MSAVVLLALQHFATTHAGYTLAKSGYIKYVESGVVMVFAGVVLRECEYKKLLGHKDESWLFSMGVR